ncbi:heterokaryon incompatibility protein Het-C-domain-containing protein [Lipomyces tetrasporus]
MAFAMRSSTISPGMILLVLVVAIVAMPSGVSAFGAGNIPSVSAIEGKNFRHGDIEDTLATVIMSTGSLISKLTGGKKFNDMSIKRVYFGNWLRDYSQAVDVGTLSRGVGVDTLRVLIWVLSFLSFGYATEEFEVTNERLGVYRAEEHIDNPKDYADNQDARKYDPRLRGLVDPQELQIDPQTGMKNYIANERGGWSTSSQYIRSSLEKSIHYGRLYNSNGKKADQYESFRLLGQALHCLEDFSAHSNFVELTLREVGYNNVFPHVGTQTAINLHGKRVYPLVTGTFGSLDFLHSLLGEAQDHLSQTEVEELDQSLEQGRNSNDSSDVLKGLLSKVPISIPATTLSRDGGDSSSRGFDDSGRSSSNYQDYYQEPQMTTDLGGEIDRLTADSHASAPNASQMSVEEIIQKIYPFLAFRDRIMKAVDAALEKIPFLNDLIDKISDTLTIFVMGLIAPFVTPLIEGVVQQLQKGSQSAVDNKDQEEVWHDPTSDNPTHSYLSKDHFSLYLNEPAGKVAKEVVSYVVPLVVHAWENTNIDPNEVLSNVLEVFHHPALASRDIQQRMRQVVQAWADGLGRDKNKVIDSLSSDGVRSGANHIGGKAPVDGHDHGPSSKTHKPKPQSTQQQPSSFVTSAIDNVAHAAGVSQYVGSSGLHFPSHIPSKFPGASLINSAANVNKLSHQFGLREGEQEYTESQTHGTDISTGDKYYAQSSAVQGDDGYARQDEYLNISQSRQNASYYSQETAYSGLPRDEESGYPVPSRRYYDDTDEQRQSLSSGFDNLRLNDDNSTGYQGVYNEQPGHDHRHEFGDYQPDPPGGYGHPDDSYGGEYGRRAGGSGGYGDDADRYDDRPGAYGGPPGAYNAEQYGGQYGGPQPPQRDQFQGGEEYYPEQPQPPYDRPAGGYRGSSHGGDSGYY